MLLAMTAACGGGGGGGGGTSIVVQRAGGPYADRGYAVAAFDDGSFVTTGFFNSTATFGVGADSVSLSDPGVRGGHVVRYNANGSVAWAHAIFGTSVTGNGVTALSGGALLVVGRFADVATFGSGPGQVVLTSRGGFDAFLARYEADGSVSWVQQAGGPNDDEAFGVGAFADSSCAITGYFGSTATFGVDSGAVDLTTSDATSPFVARYGPGGGLTWAHSAAGEVFDEHLALASFADGSCVITGSFYSQIIFGESPSTVTLTAVDLNTYVARYDVSGSLLWAKQVHGDHPNNNEGTGVAALADGSSIVCGRFNQLATFGSGPGAITLNSHGSSDIYVVRLDPTGNPVWARHAGGERDDRAYAVSAFADGSCVITGRFEAAATFGEGAEAVELLAYGTWDAFVARYAPDGRFEWAGGGGGGRLTSGYGIAASTGGACVVTGGFTETMTFGAFPGTHDLMGSNGEIFIARYGSAGGL